MLESSPHVSRIIVPAMLHSLLHSCVISLRTLSFTLSCSCSTWNALNWLPRVWSNLIPCAKEKKEKEWGKKALLLVPSSSLDFLICASQPLVTFISCVCSSFFFSVSFSPIRSWFFLFTITLSTNCGSVRGFFSFSLRISSSPQFMIVISCALSLSWRFVAPNKKGDFFFFPSLQSEFIFYVFEVLTWTYLCEVSLVLKFFLFLSSCESNVTWLVKVTKVQHYDASTIVLYVVCVWHFFIRVTGRHWFRWSRFTSVHSTLWNNQCQVRTVKQVACMFVAASPLHLLHSHISWDEIKNMLLV